MLMDSLNIMFKLKLNKFNVVYVYQIANKNLLKLHAHIIFVMIVL